MLKLGYTMSFFLLSSTFIMASLSGSVWQSWVFMELNLLFFIYWAIFNTKTHKSLSNLALVYFLIQSSSSLGVFWTLVMHYSHSDYCVALGSLFLFMKLGMIPFHYWIISVVKNLDTLGFYILMVTQKIIPLLFLRFSETGLLLLIFNLVASVLLSFSETQVFYMLVYSSVFNLIWVISSIPVSMGSSVLFYLVYSLNLGVLLAYCSSDVLNSKTSWNSSSDMVFKSVLIVSLMSLSGFPGTIGFYAKVMISDSVYLYSPELLVFLVVSSTAFIYLYIRVFFPKFVGSVVKKGLTTHSILGLPSLGVISILCPLGLIWGLLRSKLKGLSFYYLLNKMCKCF